MSAVSALAIGNSLFFGLHLCLSRNASYSNKLLAGLLFALALRISKSVIIIAFPESSEIFPAIGLTGMVAIGPFTYLYLKSLAGSGFKKKVLLHFAPSFFIALSAAFVGPDVVYFYYQLAVGQIFVYLILSIVLLVPAGRAEKTSSLKRNWCIRLVAGVLLIWLAFAYQLVADSLLSYVIATAIAVAVLYVLAYWSMQRRKIFSFGFSNGAQGSHLKKIAYEVEGFFKKDKIYLQEDITLKAVAREVKYEPYLISRAINDVFCKTFPEFLNSYRVEAAKEKLANDVNKSLSIESIAYDSGFRTLSSFYSSFKKFAKMTPAEYRKKFAT